MLHFVFQLTGYVSGIWSEFYLQHTIQLHVGSKIIWLSDRLMYSTQFMYIHYDAEQLLMKLHMDSHGPLKV